MNLRAPAGVCGRTPWTHPPCTQQHVTIQFPGSSVEANILEPRYTSEQPQYKFHETSETQHRVVANESATQNSNSTTLVTQPFGRQFAKRSVPQQSQDSHHLANQCDEHYSPQPENSNYHPNQCDQHYHPKDAPVLCWGTSASFG